MKTITPESANQIINSLAEWKDVGVGDKHPQAILLGDVLEKLPWKGDGSHARELLKLWGKCGISKSFQEIAEGWEEKIDMSENPARTCGFNCRSYVELKPEVESLLVFIQSLKL